MSLRDDVMNGVLKDASALKVIPARGIRQRSIDTQRGARLPIQPGEGDQFFLVKDGVVVLARHTSKAWEYIGTPAVVLGLPTSPYDGQIVAYRTDASYDTEALLRWNEASAEWHQLGVPPYVTSLPTPPFDGFEVFYAANATTGVIWHLRYRAGGGTYKWEHVGGGPLSAEVQTDATATATSYGAPATGTAGPAITIPLAGDYVVSFGGGSLNSSALDLSFISPTRGSATAVDTDAIRHGEAAANQENTSARSVLMTGLTATQAVTLQYRVTGGTMTTRNRWVQLLPRRVG